MPYRPKTRLWMVVAGLFALMPLLAAQVSHIASAQTDDPFPGSYSVAIGREDVPTDQADGYAFVGNWTLVFEADGTYYGERQDVGILVTGSYTVQGSEIELIDETGLVSCANPSAVTVPGGDISAGTYEWALVGQTLTFVQVDDQCPGRSLLLTTRPFTIFVPCLTTPLTAAPEQDQPATPVAVAAEDDDDDAGGLFAMLTPEADAAPTDQSPIEIAAAIDELLAQMTACWRTNDPDLWLPLLSADFRASLESGSPDFRSTIQAAMATPIVWERAGDIDIQSPERVTAIVRTTIALEQDFQRFAFVLEDGEWRWDG